VTKLITNVSTKGPKNVKIMISIQSIFYNMSHSSHHYIMYIMEGTDDFSYLPAIPREERRRYFKGGDEYREQHGASV
jgi:hypothetical protein